MLNLIRADFYRIFRGKAFWITLIVLITILVISSFIGAFNTGMMNATAEELRYLTDDLSGSFNQLYQMAYADSFFYFFLPILVIFITADFSGGTVKNILARGGSRTKYYLSKLTVSAIFCSIIVFIYATLPFILGTIIHGSGDYFNTFDYGRILLTQVPIFLAVTSIRNIHCNYSKKDSYTKWNLYTNVYSSAASNIIINIYERWL